jgi:hypothetical protein
VLPSNSTRSSILEQEPKYNSFSSSIPWHDPPSTSSSPINPKGQPRPSRVDVATLDREFKNNPKPTTQKKRQLAYDMRVDLARINVTSNKLLLPSAILTGHRIGSKIDAQSGRRRYRKLTYEAGQTQEALGYSNSASPDFNHGTLNDNKMPQQSSASFPILSGSPPPVASYDPQFSDPSSLSMESLFRIRHMANGTSEQRPFHARKRF